jgi:EmrB/QacA subfamily drug resistance transporter
VVQPVYSESSAHKKPGKIPLRILVPLIVAVGLFMENLDATVLSTALPAIARDLLPKNESPIELKLALASYLLTLAVFIPASGWFADRFGTRLIFRAAIFVFALGSALCGLSNSIETLVAARAVQGIGGAMMMPVGRLVILRTIPRSELVGALAWLTLPALIGPVLGPPVGGFIATYFSWRWIFWINLPVALVGIILATFFIPNIYGETIQKFDILGFFLSGIGLSALVAASALVEGHIVPISFVIGLFIIGLILMAAYLVHAKRCDHPILDFSLLKWPTFRSGITGGSLFRIGTGARPLLLPLLFQLGFGMSALQSGLLTFVAAIGAMGMKPVGSVILKKFGFRHVLVVNSIVASALLVAPLLFKATSPLFFILAILFVGGFFASLQFTCINAITFAEIEQLKMSQATSLSSVFQQLSLSLGITVAASVLQFSVATHQKTEIAPQDFIPAFLVIGVISLLSLVSFARLPSDAGAEIAGRKRADGSAAVAIAEGRTR